MIDDYSCQQTIMASLIGAEKGSARKRASLKGMLIPKLHINREELDHMKQICLEYIR